MLTATYPIRLPVFEGPLDLLLELIEERQLDITAVSLAQVADQYLAVIEELGRRTLADLTGFLVVAAKLLVIKSRVLLPDYRAGEGEEDEDTAEFIQQLEVYQFFRRMARELERLEERGWRCYVRVGKSGDRRLPPDPRLYLEGVTLEDLLAAARAAFQVLPSGPPVEAVVAPITVTVQEQMEKIREALRQVARVRFQDLLSEAASRVEVIVTLLAVLELLKQGLVRARQEGLFGPIFVEAAGPAT
ncbi:MAG: segregation/condensation protein A [Anaerolineae bacterium]|nr:segregation/condensation protein A [Anaerolineae bacterium]MCX8068043.1 segregation/condensation protein A [Anaerolineae bacterium]MDW7992828.1 segregation/condensation protein A [Anaerolineae bacterium]